MKTSFFKTALICSSLVLALTACSEDKKEQITITANQQMDSQQLADAGEQLMMPQSLHLAHKVFAMALTKDPENKKAQFYQAFLERFMIFEGILTRVQPYVDKYADSAQYAQTLKNLPNHSMRKFLMTPKAGAAQIKSLADMQNLLVEYRLASEKFRNFIIQNQDINLDLYLNPYLFNDAIEENRVDSCKVSNTDGNYEVVCDASEIATIKVNMADLMALKQIAAGEIALTAIYTSYSVGSIDELARRGNDNTLKTTQEAYAEFENIKDAGLLMKNQGLTAMRNLGSDFVVGIKWALKYQSSLCKKDEYGRAVARKGFLMKDICIDNPADADKALKSIEMVLAGNMQVPVQIDDSRTVTTTINYMAPLDRPVVDLRSVLPATWSNDGMDATSLRDKSLGGLFPNRDAESLLIKRNR